MPQNTIAKLGLKLLKEVDVATAMGIGKARIFQDAKISSIAPYSHRLATVEDTKAIAPLWQAFDAERESIDPSMLVKPNFDFEKYVTNQIEKPVSFCWLLEHSDSNSPRPSAN